MATTSGRSTPTAQLSQAPVSTPSPGRWRHPKFDEIARRQNANNFDDQSIRQISWNGGALLLLWLVGANIDDSWYDFLLPKVAQQYMPYTRLLISCLLIYNIVLAALPAIRSKDDLSDILLTPTQRGLLGLDPNSSSAPAIPGTQYITPPRYSQSPTPRNSSPLSKASSSAGSLGSRKGSPLTERQGSDSPFSPLPSPLWHKAVGSGRDSSRRNSYGSPSPLGPGGGKDVSFLGAPGTPSPSTGRGPSVGLNSRWLYERGRSSPSGRSLYS